MAQVILSFFPRHLANLSVVDFEIDGVKEVKWNNYAFERLILPNDHKDLLLAFAKGQRDSTEEFDDIIEGKGKLYLQACCDRKLTPETQERD